jgi:predicted flavoprotein YhiN
VSKSLIIIGGGASGMIAGILSARLGHRVTILEKLSSLGKKILVTGNGRCNITNTNLSYERFFYLCY